MDIMFTKKKINVACTFFFILTTLCRQIWIEPTVWKKIRTDV